MRYVQLTVLLFGGFYSHAQQTHVVNLASNQPPPLVADAGQDVLFFSGVEIGGNPTATGGVSPYVYAWSPGVDLSDSEVPNPTIDALNSEFTFVLTVTDANNCTAIDEVTVTLSPLSVVNDAQIRVYPTVASHSLTIETADQLVKVKLLDINGKQHKAESVQGLSHQMNVQMLNPGLYLLQLETVRGLSTIKIIIQ